MNFFFLLILLNLYDSKRTNHKIKIKRKLLGIPIMRGMDMDISVTEFPEKSTTPIVLNDPSSEPPEQKEANNLIEKPTVIVPEIIYPIKKRRIVIHHNLPRDVQRNQMLMNMSAPYWRMMHKNPYWNSMDFMNTKFAQNHNVSEQYSFI